MSTIPWQCSGTQWTRAKGLEIVRKWSPMMSTVSFWVLGGGKLFFLWDMFNEKIINHYVFDGKVYCSGIKRIFLVGCWHVISGTPNNQTNKVMLISVVSHRFCLKSQRTVQCNHGWSSTLNPLRSGGANAVCSNQSQWFKRLSTNFRWAGMDCSNVFCKTLRLFVRSLPDGFLLNSESMWSLIPFKCLFKNIS